MDPRHVLLAAGHRAADAGLEERQHRRQRAAVLVEHDAGADEHDAARVGCGLRLALPGDADPARKSSPGGVAPASARRRAGRSSRPRRTLISAPVAAACASPATRLRVPGLARLADALLDVVRPALGDGLAGQVDDGVAARRARRRAPARRSGPSSRRPRRRSAARAFSGDAAQHRHLVAALPVSALHQPRPDQARRSRRSSPACCSHLRSSRSADRYDYGVLTGSSGAHRPAESTRGAWRAQTDTFRALPRRRSGYLAGRVAAAPSPRSSPRARRRAPRADWLLLGRRRRPVPGRQGVRDLRARPLRAAAQLRRARLGLPAARRRGRRRAGRSPASRPTCVARRPRALQDRLQRRQLHAGRRARHALGSAARSGGVAGGARRRGGRRRARQPRPDRRRHRAGRRAAAARHAAPAHRRAAAERRRRPHRRRARRAVGGRAPCSLLLASARSACSYRALWVPMLRHRPTPTPRPASTTPSASARSSPTRSQAAARRPRRGRDDRPRPPARRSTPAAATWPATARSAPSPTSSRRSPADHGAAGRFGGEEFCLVLPGFDAPRAAGRARRRAPSGCAAVEFREAPRRCASPSAPASPSSRPRRHRRRPALRRRRRALRRQGGRPRPRADRAVARLARRARCPRSAGPGRRDQPHAGRHRGRQRGSPRRCLASAAPRARDRRRPAARAQPSSTTRAR